MSGDSGELKVSATATDIEIRTYQGSFRSFSNTDSGIIGPILSMDHNIPFEILGTGDIKDAAFHSANGSSFSLPDSTNSISSFIVGFRSQQICE